MSNLETIPFDNMEFREDDLYYIVKTLDDGAQWELMGIFENKNEAFKNCPDGMAIVRASRNKLYPIDNVHPSQSWWKINGEILQSGRFING